MGYVLLTIALEHLQFPTTWSK